MWVRGWFSLSCLLGISWLLGLTYIGEYSTSRIFPYLFVLVNGLQGLFIFTFRCVLDEKVRAKFIKVYRNLTMYTQLLWDYRKYWKAPNDSDDSGVNVAFIHEQQSSSGTGSDSYSYIADRNEILVRVDCKLGGRSFEVMEAVRDNETFRTTFLRKGSGDEKSMSELNPLRLPDGTYFVPPCHVDDVYTVGWSRSPGEGRSAFPPVMSFDFKARCTIFQGEVTMLQE